MACSEAGTLGSSPSFEKICTGSKRLLTYSFFEAPEYIEGRNAVCVVRNRLGLVSPLIPSEQDGKRLHNYYRSSESRVLGS